MIVRAVTGTMADPANNRTRYGLTAFSSIPGRYVWTQWEVTDREVLALPQREVEQLLALRARVAMALVTIHEQALRLLPPPTPWLPMPVDPPPIPPRTEDDPRPYVSECATLYCGTGRPLRIQRRPPPAIQLRRYLTAKDQRGRTWRIDITGCSWCTEDAICSSCHAKAERMRARA